MKCVCLAFGVNKKRLARLRDLKVKGESNLHGSCGKPSHAAKTGVKEDFLKFVDENVAPNGRRLGSSSACNSRLYGSMLSVCRHFIAMTTVANYNHGNRRHFIAMATVATFSLLPSSFEVLLPFEHVVKLSVKDLNFLAKT